MTEPKGENRTAGEAPAHYIGFQRFEQARKDTATFLALLDEKCQQGIEPAVHALKASGVCVDLYQSGRYNKLFKKSVDLLVARFGEHSLISRLQDDVSYFNALFKDFDERRQESGISEIPESQQVSAYVLAVETRLSALADYVEGMHALDLKKIYPLPLPEVLDFGARIPNSQRVPLGHWADDINESIGLVLGFLRHKRWALEGIGRTVPWQYVKAAAHHIELCRTWSTLNALLELWQYFDCEVVGDCDETVRVHPTDVDLNRSLVVSIARYDAFRALWARTQPNKPFLVEPGTSVLPPKKFRDKIEELSASFAAWFFSSGDLSEKCLGVTLAEWIRAYWCLIEEARRVRGRRSGRLPLRVAEWCIAKSKDSWATLLVGAGVNNQSAEVILNELTFTEESADLQDCPLIPADGKLVLITASAMALEPAAALLSLVRREERFKGLAFEKAIRQKMTEALGTSAPSATACREVNHVDRRPYQCDGAFVLDEQLFFVECKSVSRPNTFRQYYEFLGKMEEAVGQLDEIASYYELNLRIVQETLGLPLDWKPKQIHKLIVCNVPLGRPLVMNDTFVIDWSALSMFVQRETPQLELSGATLDMGGSIFQGELTADKLLILLRTLPQATRATAWFEPVVQKLQVKDLSLETLAWRRRIYEAAPPSEEHVRTLAECYGLGVEELATAIKERATITLPDLE